MLLWLYLHAMTIKAPAVRAACRALRVEWLDDRVRPFAEQFLQKVTGRSLKPRDEDPKLRIVYDSAFSAGCPCTPRCKRGLNSCPYANGVMEEWCIFNSSRIDHIEIVDGPGQGDGRQYWDMDAEGRDKAVAAAAG